MIEKALQAWGKPCKPAEIMLGFEKIIGECCGNYNAEGISGHMHVQEFRTKTTAGFLMQFLAASCFLSPAYHRRRM